MLWRRPSGVFCKCNNFLMGKKIENLENFKIAITSTIKSIIGKQNIDVIFGNETKEKNINFIRLPVIQSIDDKIDYTKVRALADSEALKLRCSDKKIYNSFEPQGNISKLLYAVAEKIRYENIGSSYFKAFLPSFFGLASSFFGSAFGASAGGASGAPSSLAISAARSLARSLKRSSLTLIALVDSVAKSANNTREQVNFIFR